MTHIKFIKARLYRFHCTLGIILNILILSNPEVLGTDQIKDFIIIDNQELEILNIAPIEQIYPPTEISPFVVFPNVMISSFWRGILIRWGFDKNKLCIDRVQAYKNGKTVVAKDLYAKNKSYADWFTGELEVGHSSCETVSSLPIYLLHIEKGILTRIEELSKDLNIEDSNCSQYDYESVLEFLKDIDEETKKEIEASKDIPPPPMPSFVPK